MECVLRRMSTTDDCLAALRHHGLLLKTDPKLPSVTTIVAGAPVRGSWWAHPAAHEIFRVTETLAARPDVLLIKLIAGKDTFVDRRLWPEILAIATSGAPWQWKGASVEAHRLHKDVERRGVVEASGSAARELEKRLLVHAEQFHTAAGSHAKRLESWTHWAERAKVDRHAVSVSEAMHTIQSVFPSMPWPRALR
jgi:hypothetical protein